MNSIKICKTNQSKLCGRSKKVCETCWIRSFASSDKAIYWSKKNDKKPNEIRKGSGGYFWFNCDQCTHEFEKRLNNISRGVWCPYCSNQKICEEDNCNVCYNKTFASHAKSVAWSHKNKKDPREIMLGTNAKFWFNCNQCSHEFELQISSLTGREHWCSYCSNQILCGQKNCSMCFEKSFASHPKSKFWSEKNKTKSIYVFKGSNSKYWFKCNDCPHEFETRLYHVTKGSWCPYCGKKNLCTNNCNTCFEKSFASHPKSRFWSEKNKKNPHEIYKNSGLKYWFKCPDCSQHFECSLDKVNNGRWCPFCKNKTEKKLLKWLIKLNLGEISFQKKFDWCKNPMTKRFFSYDFVLDEIKIIIELDGNQHFTDIYHWKSEHNNVSNRDVYKMAKALENGYSMIRILQMDVYENKNDWEIKLKNVLKIYNTPRIIYVNDGHIYDNHIKKMQITDLKKQVEINLTDIDDQNSE